MINYSRFYTNPYTNNNPMMVDRDTIKIYQNASEHLRSLASLLKTSKTSIKFYNFFTKLRIVPNEIIIDDVFKELIRLSNSFFLSDGALKNVEVADKIRKLLNFPDPNN